jgi:tRNA1(Val) A37 N6-methylase TrmN6
MPSPRPDLLLHAAITHALTKRNLPYTHPGILGDPRTQALALPGELLAAPMAIHPAEREQIEAILPDSIGPYQLGELYERAAGWRRSIGRFFTPPEVAEQMARACLASFHAAHPPRACDPALGTGNLLLALLQQAPPNHLDAWAANLSGVDRDPLATQVARAAIGLLLIDAGFPARDLRQQLITGDALLGACAPWIGQCDLVIANPPYIDSERMSREQPDWRRAISQHWASARGNWDLFVPFTELGLQLLNPTGRMAFLVPNRILSAEYAATLRGLLANRIDTVIDHSQTGIFAAGVYPVVVVAGVPHQPRQKPPKQADQASEPQTPAASSLASAWVQLDRIAHLREAATVAEAYQLGDP